MTAVCASWSARLGHCRGDHPDTFVRILVDFGVGYTNGLRVAEHYLVATVVAPLWRGATEPDEILHVWPVPYHTLGRVLDIKVPLPPFYSTLEQPVDYRSHDICCHLIMLDGHAPFLHVLWPHIWDNVARVAVAIAEVVASTSIALVHDERPANPKTVHKCSTTLHPV